MAANTIIVTVSAQMCWWVMPYLRTLALLCMACDREPNYCRVAEFLARHGFRYTFS